MKKKRFVPMSLFKVPLMITVLKKVEEGDISLDDEITLTGKDLDNRSGGLAQKGVGYKISVKDLLIKMVQESDNTAMIALSRKFTTDEDYLKAISIMGIPTPSEEQAVTVKEYVNVFRSLYYSTYLRRPFSELALSMLLETSFNSQIPAGLPEDVRVSHKVGFDKEVGYFHDCGIVYLENKDYIICVMSKGTTEEKANEAISTISRTVYEYVNSGVPLGEE